MPRAEGGCAAVALSRPTPESQPKRPRARQNASTECVECPVLTPAVRARAAGGLSHQNLPSKRWAGGEGDCDLASADTTQGRTGAGGMFEASQPAVGPEDASAADHRDACIAALQCVGLPCRIDELPCECPLFSALPIGCL
jgi:hypothetical protein